MATSNSATKLSGLVSRVRKIAPDLAIRTAVLNEDGLANDVVIVNDQWVFRFAKGEFGLASLARDRLVLQAIRPHVTLAIPDPVYAGADYIAYPLVPGEGLTRKLLTGLDEHAAQHVADQLATFLRQLNSVPTDVNLPRTAAPADRDFWVRRHDEVEERIYPLLLPGQREWAEDLFGPILADLTALAYEPRLIHGDLAPYHILFDRSTEQLIGVIDFGVAGLGDPAADISALLQACGASLVNRMTSCYPDIQSYMRRARFYAQAIELEWVLLGLKTGEPFWFTAHLGNARDL